VIAPSGWRNSFSLFQEVTIACSGETGHVVGEFINNTYLVRYRQADGVAVEKIWPADALTSTTAKVVALKVAK
jgi:hypothetical protein